MPTYIRLTDYKSSDEKEKDFFNLDNRYEAKQEDFEKIPGSPIAYWASNKIKDIFESEKLNDISTIRQGTATGDTERFIRKWFEIDLKKMMFNANSCENATSSGFKWFPITKGGEFRRYFGNNEDVISFDKENFEILLNMGNNLPSREYYFSKGITWTKISSSSFGVRFLDSGYIFSDAGMIIISKDSDLHYLIAFLVSKISYELIKVKNTSLNFQAGDLKALPIIFSSETTVREQVSKITQQNIDISKEEWDSRETSWDFTKNELIKHKSDTKIETAYANYCDYWSEKFVTLHKNEEELNRLFIDIYELGDELDEYVDFKDITILKNETTIEDILIPASTKEEAEERAKTAEGYLYNRGALLVFKADEIMKQFISYGVGVMFGRYSLDSDGLLIANMGQDMPTDTRFKIDDDNVIPVLEDDYFTDDIASRFVEFIKITFGEGNLSENMNFIEECLGKDIRKYFIKGFYEDHIKRYKKRPIYWMVSSPKKSFNALIYMHRYQNDIFARIQNAYLREYITKLESTLQMQTKVANDESNSTSDRRDATRDINNITKKLDEIIMYDRDKLTAFAQNGRDIDLDDGVKVNYCKFEEILYPIKGLCKK